MKIEQVKKWVFVTEANALELQESENRFNCTRKTGAALLDGFLVKGSHENPVFLAEDPELMVRGVQMFHEYLDDGELATRRWKDRR